MNFVEPLENWAARHAYGPQADAAPLRGVQHPLAGELLAAVKAQGKAPTPIWAVINALAKKNAKTKLTNDLRDNTRFWRVRYWWAAKALFRVQLLFRHRGLVATAPIAYRPKRRVPRETVRAQGEMCGSNAGGYAATDGSLRFGSPLGVRSRVSEAKAEAARRNGATPVRAGRKPRGRPRRGAGAGLTPG